MSLLLKDDPEGKHIVRFSAPSWSMYLRMNNPPQNVEPKPLQTRKKLLPQWVAQACAVIGLQHRKNKIEGNHEKTS